MRVLFHVQHLLGIGHDRRASLIARALAGAGHAVTVLRGGHPVPGIEYGPVSIVQLPPARAADQSFKTLLDERGRPIDDAWRARRAAAAMAAFDEVRPDVLLVESFPFGRRAFRFELLPLLEAARGAGALTACSVRDILVAKPDPARLEEVVATVERLFDRVLVHGDPDLIPFEATFPPARRLAGRLRYTGYVAAPPAAPADASGGAGAGAGESGGGGGGEVVVSVGGGAVGLPLLRAALSARALTPARDWPWRLLAGPDVPEEAVRALAAAAPSGVVVERARPDFPALLRRCRLSVSQAGYNTVLDLLQAGCPAVVVPFAAGNESEQTTRARLLEQRGRLVVVEEDGLTPQTLADGVARALALPPLPPLPLRLDGAAETARLLAEAVKPIALLGFPHGAGHAGDTMTDAMTGIAKMPSPAPGEGGTRRGSGGRVRVARDKAPDSRPYPHPAAARPPSPGTGEGKDTAPWHALAAELDAWAAAGRRAEFWWRDDDAVAPSPELERLAGLAGEHAVPLALAVIPAGAEPALAAFLDAHPLLTVLQHGWSHENHAAPPAKRCELGTDRPVETVLADLAAGKRALETLFGPRALPVLVPPWNRIAPAVESRLAELGLTGLSGFGPRAAASANLTPITIQVVNVHVDPVAWHAGGGFLGEEDSLGMVLAHLRARRLGAADPEEPTGLMTHHRAMDAETWAFAARLIAETARHPAVRWLPAGSLFGST